MAISNAAAILAIWPLDAIGPHEWVIIAVAAVLLFGRRLPELGRWLGRSIVEFKKGVRSMQEEMAKASDEEEAAAEPPAEEKEKCQIDTAKPANNPSRAPGQNP
ncbi:MAG: twin-arginine translocase TatA/TatE family subunit [Planctomycetota bacterium]|nr:twin-arginine translocase TatA/TatE family subunit [Planctomycetota bacterium]